MKTILQLLSGLTAAAFEENGYDAALGQVTLSDRPDLCDFQCNGAFKAAKLYRKPPLEIAGQIKDSLDENPIFANIELVKPGFINFTLRDSFLVDTVNSMIDSGNLGIPSAEKPRNIIIDYGGPNVAKPLHIGHLRSAVIGEAIKRTARALGHTVTADIHMGDWGLPMGLIIAEMIERYPAVTASGDLSFLHVDELCEIYPYASAKSKEDDVFYSKAKEITGALQAGDAFYRRIWQYIIALSKQDLQKTYQALNVDFDLWYGESDADPYIQPMIEKLEAAKLPYESDGALVVDVQNETDTQTIPPVIIRKSDNSSLYSTTDLATLLMRAEHNPDEVLYVVDNRQSLHFLQVFRCATMGGIVPKETGLHFLGFGTMNGKDGKPFKTRDGGTLKLSEFLETAVDSAKTKLTNSDYFAQASEAEIRGTAEKIAVAGIKFGDLINHRSKDYIFELDRFLSFDGKTGPYVLYTVTRINSIFRKAGAPAGETAAHISGIYSSAERTLLLKLMNTGDVFLQSFAEYAPNIICENVYQIASAFSGFYNAAHITKEKSAEKQASWLALLAFVKKTIEKHLDVLAIDTVDKM